MLILRRKALLPCLVSALAVACGGSSSDSPSSGTGGTAGGPKLAWDQFAPGADELRQYSYVLYVDGTATVLVGASCSALSADTMTAACTAPLPTLAPGQHTLEMATRMTRDGVVLESARSAPITYTAGASGFASGTAGATATATPAVPGRPSGHATEATDAAESEPDVVVETVVTGLDRPSALAQLPDGRLLIAERGGAVRLVESGRLLPEPAARLADADPAGDARVSLALAPDFEASRHVFVAYGTIDDRGTRTGRIVRFREVGGVLGEPAVLVDGLPAAVAAPWVAVGPDGALYVGTSAADAGEADDAASYAGKVLRFALDGTTPADNPVPASPVYSSGYQDTAGSAWDPETGGLWVSESVGSGAFLARVAAADRARERAVRLGPIGAGRLAFIPANAAGVSPAWRGSLLVAAQDQEGLLRVSGLAGSPPAPVVERALAGLGPVSAVLAAADGVYVAVSSVGSGDAAQPSGAVHRVGERRLP